MIKSNEDVDSPIHADRAWDRIKYDMMRYNMISYNGEHNLPEGERFRRYFEQMCNWCNSWINTENREYVVNK
eukprot:9670111-Karenia_brevis.AAC.1